MKIQNIRIFVYICFASFLVHAHGVSSGVESGPPESVRRGGYSGIAFDVIDKKQVIVKSNNGIGMIYVCGDNQKTLYLAAAKKKKDIIANDVTKQDLNTNKFSGYVWCKCEWNVAGFWEIDKDGYKYKVFAQKSNAVTVFLVVDGKQDGTMLVMAPDEAIKSPKDSVLDIIGSDDVNPRDQIPTQPPKGEPAHRIAAPSVKPESSSEK